MNYCKRYFSFIFILFVSASFSGCGVYSFRDTGGIPSGVKTIKIGYFDNRASYVNPLLSPQLNDAFVKLVANETKLHRVDDDNANYVITATINQYSVSTSGVSGNGTSQASQDRLTVGVHIVLRENYTANNGKEIQDEKEYDVSGNYDFAASLSLQQAETQLMTQMIKDMSENMFNKIFSNW